MGLILFASFRPNPQIYDIYGKKGLASGLDLGEHLGMKDEMRKAFELYQMRQVSSTFTFRDEVTGKGNMKSQESEIPSVAEQQPAKASSGKTLPSFARITDVATVKASYAPRSMQLYK